MKCLFNNNAGCFKLDILLSKGTSRSSVIYQGQIQQPFDLHYRKWQIRPNTLCLFLFYLNLILRLKSR